MVVWLSTTGDVLNDGQQAAFERFIRAGGGYAGIHSAADTEYDWKWYGRLVGAYFLSHPSGTFPNGGREGTVVVEDTTDRSTQGVPAPRWGRIDEWYNYKPVNFEQTGDVDYSPRANVHVLASLDESTYDEADGSDGSMTITRSRGATSTTAAAPGTRAWATRTTRSPRRRT